MSITSTFFVFLLLSSLIASANCSSGKVEMFGFFKQVLCCANFKDKFYRNS